MALKIEEKKDKNKFFIGVKNWWLGFKKTKLFIEWSAVLQILFSPVIFITLVFTVGLGYTLNNAKNPEMILVFSVLMSLSSGFLGGVIQRRWNAEFEEGIIVAKGNTAIRNLDLIDIAIIDLHNRILQYLNEISKRNAKVLKSVLKVKLDEIIVSVKYLRTQIGVSKESWMDIVPDGSIKPSKPLVEAIQSRNNFGVELLKLDDQEISKMTKSELKEMLTQIKNLEEELDYERVKNRGMKYSRNIPVGKLPPGGVTIAGQLGTSK